jgi:hypothetical protein
LVVAHRAGPKAHPSEALANATSLTLDVDGDAAGLGRGAGSGAGADQDRPPSAVVKTEVHGAWAHGEVPSTKARDGEMRSTEMGLKPAGGSVPDAPATEAHTKGMLRTSATRMFLLVFMPYLTTGG